MSDREAAIAQTHENAKRADVTPFEEADSFAHLMQHHGLNADQVAAEVGKSRSYVYGRLKLANAAFAVRAAFAVEGLSAEIALELARIHNPKVQAQALKKVRGHGGTGWLSTRDAKQVLKHAHTINLAQAPFDLGDATLLPSAGACHSCPRLSLNDPDLATEPGTFCIDTDCHSTKLAAHRERALDEMAAAGHTVLEGEEAKHLMPTAWQLPAGYLREHSAGLFVEPSNGEDVQSAGLRASSSNSARFMSFAEMCEQAKAKGIEPPKRTLVVLDPDKDPIELVREEEADALHLALGLHQVTVTPGHARAPLDPKEAIAHDREAWARVRKAAVLSLRGKARTVQDLRLLLLERAEYLGAPGVWLDVPEEDATKWVQTASPDDLGTLLVALCLDDVLTSHELSTSERVALAESYGVDVLAVGQPAEAESTPSPAARAPIGVAAWPVLGPTQDKDQRAARADQKVNAGGAAAVERAEAEA
jgi:hypothetical protein